MSRRDAQLRDAHSLRITLEGRVEALEAFVEQADRVTSALDRSWAQKLPVVREEALALLAQVDRLAELEAKVGPAFPSLVAASSRARGRLGTQLDALAKVEGLIAGPWHQLLRTLVERTLQPVDVQSGEVVLIDGPRPANTPLFIFLAVGGAAFFFIHGAAVLVLSVGLVAGAVWLGGRHALLPVFRLSRERLLPGRTGPTFPLRGAHWRHEDQCLVVWSGNQRLRTPRGWEGAAALEAVLRLEAMNKTARAMPLRLLEAVDGSGPGGVGVMAIGRTHVTFIAQQNAASISRALFGEGHDAIALPVLTLMIAMLDEESLVALTVPGLTRVAFQELTMRSENKNAIRITAGRIDALVGRVTWARIDQA